MSEIIERIQQIEEYFNKISEVLLLFTRTS